MNILRRWWRWIRFGKVTSRVVDTINGIPCEIELTGRGGKRIGYWAYGSFDPSYPIRSDRDC